MDHSNDPPFEPRNLSLAERHDLAQRLHRDNQTWLARLADLAEPKPDRDFPAFLLATPAFADLTARIGNAQHRRELCTAVADELDHFVDAYRYYLRTDAGEDVFSNNRRAS